MPTSTTTSLEERLDDAFAELQATQRPSWLPANPIIGQIALSPVRDDGRLLCAAWLGNKWMIHGDIRPEDLDEFRCCAARLDGAISELEDERRKMLDEARAAKYGTASVVKMADGTWVLQGDDLIL